MNDAVEYTGSSYATWYSSRQQLRSEYLGQIRSLTLPFLILPIPSQNGGWML